MPAYARVRACVGALVATQIQGHGLLKRFTAKMPIYKCLIINEIKYFFKFFLQLKKIAVTLQAR